MVEAIIDTITALIEALIDTVATIVETFIDPVAAIVQSILDTIATHVDAIGKLVGRVIRMGGTAQDEKTNANNHCFPAIHCESPLYPYKVLLSVLTTEPKGEG